MQSEVTQLFESVRQMCLAQPNTFEKLSHGAPAFFIQKGGQFATLWDNHHNDGNIALLVAAMPGVQEELIEQKPEIYYRPPYVGTAGWVGVRLDRVHDWAKVEDLVVLGYEIIAAKKKRR